MEIIYLKLINGDELFAKLMGKENSDLLLDDVLVMETVPTGDDAVKYMFMSRYTAYSKLHSMKMDLNKIVFSGEVSETVKNHYLKSLEFAIKISDERLMDSISEASQYLSLVIDKESKKNGTSKKDDLLDQLKIFGDRSIPPTKH
jgi:hypothetical protein